MFKKGSGKMAAFTFTEELLKNGFRSFSDVDIALQEISNHTGYTYSFICSVWDDLKEDLQDGFITVSEAVAEISDTACERDY